MPAPDIHLFGLSAVPEVTPGADVADLIRSALCAGQHELRDGDVLVVTHKVISKAEGQLVDLRTVEPSALARGLAEVARRDPRHIEVVLRESARIVRMDRGIIISETRHGFVCANAGVDASNVAGDEVVCLLPRDPDASARRLCDELARDPAVNVAVVISDSFGRPWRNGIVNVAIGVAGIAPLVDYRGQPDDYGRVMNASILAIADELASAAELVMGKVSRCPVVVVRGYSYERRAGTARELVMDPGMDMFR